MQTEDDNTFRSQQQRPRSSSSLFRRRWRKGRLGCWSAKIKRDPIIGITTSQWAGNSLTWKTPGYLVCTLVSHKHTHTFTPQKPTGAICVFAQKAHISFLLYSRKCSCAHMHTLIPNQVWILIISLSRPLWNYYSHLLIDEKTWSEKTQTYTNFSIKILKVGKSKEQNKRLQPKLEWLH